MGAKGFLLSSIFAASLLWTAGAVAETVEGAGKALAGDRIEVAGKQFFINGIVAPKGAGADFALVSLLKKGPVKCSTEVLSQGSKPTATCKVGNEDVGTSLVSIGAAVPFIENGTDLREHRLQEHKDIAGLDDGLTPPRDCTIKGNRSTTGKDVRIYHMPGDPHYLRTKINVAKGEAWFCSEADAVAAGYKRAGNAS